MKFKFLNLLIIFLSMKFSKIYTISFSYPNAVVTLKEGNIFIIHKFGICICDSSFTTIIKEIYTFQEEEQIINEERMSKLEILQFDNGYLICLIIDKIYIFNMNGDLEFKSSPLIVVDISNFSLSSDKILNNCYYYLLGYIYQSSLYLYYYEYNSLTKKNSLIAKKEKFYDRFFYSGGRYEEYPIKNKGLSCQFLKLNFEDIITCFYSIYYTYDCISISYFIINGNSLEVRFNNVQYKWKNIEIIKSSITSDHKKSLFCFFLFSGAVNCIFYDFYYNNEINMIISYSKKCLNKYYGIKVNYFKNSNEFVFSCLTLDGGIQIETYYKNFKNINKNEIYPLTDCSYINGYSILYLNNEEDYFIISDALCHGVEKYFTKLMVNNYKEKEENNQELFDTQNIINYNNNEITEEENEKNNENNENTCLELEKCEICNEESISKNKCIKCNNKKGYYFLNNTFSKEIINEEYIDCVNSTSKPKNFYFNKKKKIFNPCFETCATCIYEGNENENNCTSCSPGFISKPEINNSSNCIINCLYYYYYTTYDQYKCTRDLHCPEGYNFFIKDKGKCIDSCEKDNIFKYEFNEECFKECPNNTYNEENQYICKYKNINDCSFSEH